MEGAKHQLKLDQLRHCCSILWNQVSLNDSIYLHFIDSCWRKSFDSIICNRNCKICCWFGRSQPWRRNCARGIKWSFGWRRFSFKWWYPEVDTERYRHFEGRALEKLGLQFSTFLRRKVLITQTITNKDDLVFSVADGQGKVQSSWIEIRTYSCEMGRSIRRDESLRTSWHGNDKLDSWEKWSTRRRYLQFA